MKILCFGAGAIGSYIAGSLALIGNPLVYIEQPQFIESLKMNGVRAINLYIEQIRSIHLRYCGFVGNLCFLFKSLTF